MSEVINNQLRIWDLTVWQPLSAQPEMAKLLERLAEKWAFQYEIGDAKDSREHFQVKYCLRKPKFDHQIIKACKGTLLEGHLTKSSTKSGEKFNYQMKLFGVIAGPWTDKDTEAETKKPRDLEGRTLFPWQQAIKEVCITERDTRFVHVLSDFKGNTGKSFLARIADYEEWAGWIPAYDNCKDMLQAVYGTGARPAYIIDCPRGKNTKGIWMGIEQIKNGIIIDARHKFKKRRMNIPVVWVFTNQPINREWLSKDRWRIYNVIGGKLVELEMEE